MGSATSEMPGQALPSPAGTGMLAHQVQRTAGESPSLPEVDWMSAEGVVRGDSRQQVSLKGSKDGHSHVLGDLSARGIRVGAHEALTPTRTLSGEAAVQALFASGQIRGGVQATPSAGADSAVPRAQLNRPEATNPAGEPARNVGEASGVGQGIGHGVGQGVGQGVGWASAQQTADGVAQAERASTSVGGASGVGHGVGWASAQQTANELPTTGSATGAEASGLSRQMQAQMQAQVQRQVEAGLQASATDPGLRALLVPDGTPLTVSDETGHVRLTLAGQARVQEVYNRLRLDESYEKHADQATAQAVTLVAAIVLTVATGGTSIGLALGQSGATAVMTNAAAIGMGSTMIGQWAGGASFDEAFQAGMKSGAISAVAAGVSYGVADHLGLTPTGVDETGKLTYSEAAKQYYALPAFEKLGTGPQPCKKILIQL